MIFITWRLFYNTYIYITEEEPPVSKKGSTGKEAPDADTEEPVEEEQETQTGKYLRYNNITLICHVLLSFARLY